LRSDVTVRQRAFLFVKVHLGARHSVIERKKMSYSTSSEEDERDQVIIPNAILAQAKEAIERMVPPKSKLLYEKEYKLFFSLLVSEPLSNSRTDPRSRISLPRLIIIFIINQGQ
jgi:hypothetical protein